MNCVSGPKALFVSLYFLFILTGLCSSMIAAMIHYFAASCSEVVTWVFTVAGELSHPANQCEEVRYVPQMKSFFDNRLLGSGSVARLHAVILRCSLIALKELPQPPDLDLSGSRGFYSTVTTVLKARAGVCLWYYFQNAFELFLSLSQTLKNYLLPEHFFISFQL